MMKSTRQNVILSIIEKENIETQNQLMSALASLMFMHPKA